MGKVKRGSRKGARRQRAQKPTASDQEQFSEKVKSEKSKVKRVFTQRGKEAKGAMVNYQQLIIQTNTVKIATGF